MPLLEALACGTPVIASSGGGAADFLTPDFAYLVEAHEFVARNSTEWMGMEITGPGVFLQPNQAHLAYLMRYVAL